MAVRMIWPITQLRHLSKIMDPSVINAQETVVVIETLCGEALGATLLRMSESITNSGFSRLSFRWFVKS